MTYNSNRMMGLNALSPQVAIIDQQAKLKDIAPENLAQWIKDPNLLGALAHKMQLDTAAAREKQLAQQPQSAPPTVAQKYAMAAAQQGQMDQGLGGMPAPTMDRASFAGGGIVAFDEGGEVEHFANQGLVDLGASARNKEGIYNALVNSIQQDLAAGKITQLEAAQKLQQAYGSMGIARRTQDTGNFSNDMGLGDFSENMGIAKSSESQEPPVAPAVTKSPALTTKKPTASTSASSNDGLDYASSLESAPDYAGTLGTDSYDYLKDIGEKPNLEKMRAAEDIAAKTSGYGKYSKALSDEENLIKQQKEDYSSDKKEAMKNFWIKTGMSLMANKSPHFAVALGESLSDNYNTTVKDLQKLKDSNDALEQKKIELAYKREQALQSNDAKVMQEYNTALNNYRTRVANYQTQQDNIQQRAIAARESSEARKATVAAARASGNMPLIEKFMKTINPDTGKLYTLPEAYDFVQSGSSTVKSAGIRAITAQITNLESRKAKLETARNVPWNDEATNQRIDSQLMGVESELAQLRNQARGGAASVTIPSGGTATNSGTPMNSGTTSSGTKYQIVD